MMGVTVTVGLMVLLFKPKWLDDIQPQNPANRFAGDPVYPPSRLTANVVTPASLALRSTGSEEWHGWAFCCGEIVDSASRSHEAQAARCARKAARREEMGSRWHRTDPNGYASRNAKAERRAAKEARRIMMARRQQIIAAFTAEEM